MVTPGRLQKSFFGNGGAEAIEGAFRLAKRYSGKNEFLAIESSFHGRSYATLSVTGNSGRKKGGGPYMPGVAFVPTPYCYRCFAETTPDKCDMLCARRVGEVARLHLSGSVCAFIAEPVMGEGGIIVPPDDYFRRVKEILDEEGILFIADEVQSGFGRTGKLFAIEHFGVEPDIMTMAKGIADGWPLSAFIARAEIADAFQIGDHLCTFGGNPVSCAASLANIDFLMDGVVDGAARKGDALMARFEELKKTQPLIGDVRGKGLMVGVELIADPATKAYGTAAAGFVRQYCLDHGVLIGVGGNFGIRAAHPAAAGHRRRPARLGVRDGGRRPGGIRQAVIDRAGPQGPASRRPPGGRTPHCGEGREAGSASRPSRRTAPLPAAAVPYGHWRAPRAPRVDRSHGEPTRDHHEGVGMSSTEDGPQVQMQRDSRPSSPGYGKLIAPAVIAIVIIILILQNTKEDWRIHFFFWWFSLPAALMLVLLLLVGFLVGLAMSAVLRRRRRAQLKRKAATY